MLRVGLLGFIALALMSGLTLLSYHVDEEPLLWDDFALDTAENVVFVGTMMVVAWMVLEIKEFRREQEVLRTELVKAVAMGNEWRDRSRAHLEGLSKAIQQQFDEWALTEAEKDIAGFMLKGLSLKHIARLRNTSEATIRQQAVSVYKKSNLAGRAELSAYFLEDLFMPVSDEGPPKNENG